MNTAVSPGSLLLGMFRRRDICDSAPKIPYWWCRLRVESDQEVLIGWRNTLITGIIILKEVSIGV